jgi:hypothetical protein
LNFFSLSFFCLPLLSSTLLTFSDPISFLRFFITPSLPCL